MKPRFYNTPSPLGLVLLAGAFTLVSRPRWKIREKKLLVRAAGRVFAAMVSLMAAGACAQSVQPIYSFPQSPVMPFAGLAEGPDGDFYGTTFYGGSGGEGTVFKVTANGVMTLLYSFSPPTASAGSFVTNSDGAHPESALALGPDGNFYGTTWNGGSSGNGTAFKDPLKKKSRL